MKNRFHEFDLNNIERFDLTQGNWDLTFYDGQLKKLIVGWVDPPLGTGLMLGFGTDGARIFQVSWPASKRTHLIHALRAEISALSLSSAKPVGSRISISFDPEANEPVSFTMAAMADGNYLEMRFTKASALIRILINRQRAEALVSFLEVLKPGFQNVRVLA